MIHLSTNSQRTAHLDEIVISSGDRLTTETITEFIHQVHQAMQAADSIIIEFQQDVEMDITALQLLCTLYKTAADAGRHLSHRGPVPKMILELTTDTGFERCEHCINHKHSCLRQFHRG